MREKAIRALLQRIALLSVLVVWLVLLALPANVYAMECLDCDLNLWPCLDAAVTPAQINACYFSYSICLNGCTYQWGGGGGGGQHCSGCGRNQCDLDCLAQRGDCSQAHGTTCGADYIECEQGCL
jgi:hypothetical protein